MKIPKLQSTISALLPKAQVLSTIPPDEVVSIGCAKQSAYLNGSDFDDFADQVDIEITTLPEDIYVKFVTAAGESIPDVEKELIFKKGALIPSIHGATVTKQITEPNVKLEIEQGNHIDHVETNTENGINEITARLHGGARQSNDHTVTYEPATIHIHVN